MRIKQENPSGGELYTHRIYITQQRRCCIMGTVAKGCLGAVLGLIAIVIIGVMIASCAGGSKDQGGKSAPSSSSSAKQEQARTYADADINVLIREAKTNAAAANKNYKGKDVKIVGGILENIDSDLSYITINGTDRNYSFLHVRCSIKSKNKELQDAVLKLQKGQAVTVYGRIADVGDVMGYYLDLDKVETAK